MAGRRRPPSNAPGAHYLADPRIAADLLDAACVRRGDLVLDVGAGGGALTARIASRGARVVAIERDPRLAARLRRRFECANVVVVECDALDVRLPRRPYRVVANIPFAITTALLGHLLDEPRASLQAGALIVGLHAARRFAHPRPASARILWWSARYELRVVGQISGSSFSPPSPVAAGALLVKARRRALVPSSHQRPFLSLLSVALADRRAPVGHALASIFTRRQLHHVLDELHMSRTEAIGELTVEQWSTVTAAMVAFVDRSRWPPATTWRSWAQPRSAPPASLRR